MLHLDTQIVHHPRPHFSFGRVPSRPDLSQIYMFFCRVSLALEKITKVLLFKKTDKYNMKYLHTNIKCILMNFVETGSPAEQGYDPRPQSILPSKGLFSHTPSQSPRRKFSRL